MSKQWMPVEDGNHGRNGDAHVRNNGSAIEVADYWAYLKDNERVCRLTDVPDAPSVSVPVDAIDKLLLSYYMRHGQNETYRTVNAWLAQAKGGE